MTRNRQLIAAQVVVSAVALAVVFATLLDTDPNNPLSGVEAPNQLAPQGGGDEDGKQGAGDGADAGSAAAGGGAAIVPGAATAAGPGTTPALGALTPGTDAPGIPTSGTLPPAALTPGAVTDDGPRGGGEDKGPPGIQYRNTLSQLRARLNSG